VYYPKGFDRDRAIQLAELVEQAYGQLEAFKNNEAWSLRDGYSLVTELRYASPLAAPTKGPAAYLEKELRQLGRSKSYKGGEGVPIGFIACYKSDAFLIFRGTMTAPEWIRDFNIRLTPYPYIKFGKVHDGFIQIYDALREAVQGGLGRIGNGKRLFISGNSMGAALATLAAPDIVSSRGVKSLSIYTFASPRVGDKAFAAKYNHRFKERSFRIANTCDLVVSMPFPVPFLGFLGGYFTHVETPIDFTVQREDLEKNHDLETYLEALKVDTGRRGLLRYLFK
jgi:hypothetical protein